MAVSSCGDLSWTPPRIPHRAYPQPQQEEITWLWIRNHVQVLAVDRATAYRLVVIDQMGDGTDQSGATWPRHRTGRTVRIAIPAPATLIPGERPDLRHP